MELNWQYLGAWTGGTVYSVTLSPDFATDHLALAATAAGLYRSMDSGQTWTLSTTGLSDPTLVTVGFAPSRYPYNQQDEQRAFVATSSGRLFTSLDGGQTWTEVLAWAGLGVIMAFAISPAFAEDQTLFVATSEGVFRSQDGGQHWESSTFGLLDLDILCLACAPDFASSGVLWAGTAQGGFYRSRNAGRSWRDAGAGLPETAIQCLAVSPDFAIDQTLWVGTQANGLYRSPDGGLSWHAVGEAFAEQSIHCLTITAASPMAGQAMLVGADNGVYGSYDGGQTWTASQQGEFTALAFALSSTGWVLAGAVQAGVYLSTDAGKSWRQAVIGLAAHAPPVVNQSAKGEFFALDADGRMAYSQDQGAHWQALDVDPELAITAFTMTGDAQTTLLYAVTAEGQLYQRSANLAWADAGLVLADAPLFSLLTPSPAFAQDHLLALGDEAGGLYLWQTIEPKPVSLVVPWQNATLLQIAFSPNYVIDQTLCTVTAQLDDEDNYQIQLWHSSDKGQQWTTLAEFQTELPAVVLAWPIDPTEHALFLATRNRVIKIFTNPADQQLAVVQSFLDEGLRITALAVGSGYAADKTLFAATNRGVYQGQMSGLDWTPLGEGLAERVIIALFPATASNVFSVVTLGGEVWQLQDKI